MTNTKEENIAKLADQGRKIEQIALYCPTLDGHSAIMRALQALGCRHWVLDTVKAGGFVFGVSATNEALLAFNYELIPGIEFELLHYKSGDNWHRARGVEETTMSHCAWHVDDTEKELEFLADVLGEVHVAQEVVTTSHTNDHLRSLGRHYRYVVLDSVGQVGFDIKLIQRI